MHLNIRLGFFFFFYLEISLFLFVFCFVVVLFACGSFFCLFLFCFSLCLLLVLFRFCPTASFFCRLFIIQLDWDPGSVSASDMTMFRGSHLVVRQNCSCRARSWLSAGHTKPCTHSSGNCCHLTACTGWLGVKHQVTYLLTACSHIMLRGRLFVFCFLSFPCEGVFIFVQIWKVLTWLVWLVPQPHCERVSL